MKKATLDQAHQLLGYILEKEFSLEQLQILFESGLLTDLLDSNIYGAGKRKRNEIRHILGLELLYSKFIVDINSNIDLERMKERVPALEMNKAILDVLEIASGDIKEVSSAKQSEVSTVCLEWVIKLNPKGLRQKLATMNLKFADPMTFFVFMKQDPLFTKKKCAYCGRNLSLIYTLLHEECDSILSSTGWHDGYSLGLNEVFQPHGHVLAMSR
jgi:hypothetical protein